MHFRGYQQVLMATPNMLQHFGVILRCDLDPEAKLRIRAEVSCVHSYDGARVQSTGSGVEVLGL